MDIDIDIDIEVIKLILTVTNIIFVPIVGGTLYNSIESFKKRKLKILLESQVLTDKLDQQFIIFQKYLNETNMYVNLYFS